MKTVVETHGMSKAETGHFKREREAWASAIYALSLSEIYRKKYWIEIETVEQTPDTRVIHIDQSAGHNICQIQHVEVVDWEEHVADPMTLITAKCAKAYPAHFCLLIAARSGKRFNPEDLRIQVAELRIPFAEIWMIWLAGHNDAYSARLRPSPLLVQFNVLDALVRAKVPFEMLCRMKRGKSTNFEDLGVVYLPIE